MTPPSSSDTPPVPVEELDFTMLGLAEPLVKTVLDLGYEEPTPIQRAAIPVLLAGRDLLGLAATGTGKTAAFALPLLHHLHTEGRTRSPRALVVVPTRELAVQVAQAIHTYGKGIGAQALAVYGGSSFGLQARALQRGVDVVVATPGRALDHLGRGTLRLDAVADVVLDEADEMLDMGFQEDIEALLAAVPTDHRTALFSATFPSRLRTVARNILRDPLRVEVEPEHVEEGEVPRVRQVVYLVRREHKEAALARILDMESPTAALVFCRTRGEVDGLADALGSRGYRAEALHGGLSQVQRDRVMEKLRGGASDLVIATDVAARGLDVDQLSHVVNYDLPASPEQYVHRIGRTGRAGREGVAISLAEPRERRLLRAIEHRTGQPLSLEPVPSAADLRERRMELVLGQVRAAVQTGGLQPYRKALAPLREELDIEDVAAAALKALAELQAADAGEQDIPSAHLPVERPRVPTRQPRESGSAWVRLRLEVGRMVGVRPGDLFGAIVGETGLPRGVVGAIQITDRVSYVEVAEDEAEQIMQALRHTTIRGRKVIVRWDEGSQR